MDQIAGTSIGLIKCSCGNTTEFKCIVTEERIIKQDNQGRLFVVGADKNGIPLKTVMSGEWFCLLCGAKLKV